MRTTIRNEVQIARPADQVWELVGDPARIQEWFPGITDSTVEGDQRVITNGAGQRIPERIVAIDPEQRRFQYEMRLPICTFHLGTVDVVELDSEHCLVDYTTEAEPAALALMIGGAAGAALDHLTQILTP
jgi:uncharacterized protein YndB with AHSA1/START domain